MTKKINLDKAAIVTVNKLAHDKWAQHYDELHVEIYNPTEQARIRNVTQRAFDAIETEGKIKRVLDFGSGTGNLTVHLWRLGAEVVGADVSAESLKRIKEKIRDPSRLSTLVLNSDTLSTIAENTFDMVGSYSVLHHVPDYLNTIDEFVRIVRPGGIIYVDHEVSPSYWEMSETYNAYLKDLGGRFLQDHLYELDMVVPEPQMSNTFFSKRWFSHLFNRNKEGITRVVGDYGDIHVFMHDHIEWENIASHMSKGCDVIAKEDYLVCRERTDDPVIWQKWRHKCSDMRYMIFRKRSA